MQPKNLVERMIKRLSRDRFILYDDDFNELIWSVARRYSCNPHCTVKSIAYDIVDNLYIGVYEKIHAVRVGLKGGEHYIRKRGGEIVSLEEFKQELKIGRMLVEEVKCKKNKTLINKLNKERLKWQRLQQQAN